MLGFDREMNVVNLGDTAELTAYLYTPEDQPMTADDVASVEFTLERPDGTRETVAGTIAQDGAGVLNYNNTDLEGEYVVVAKFSLPGGVTKSTRDDFTVADPFKPVRPDREGSTALGSIDALVWDKFADLFDSADGGPWMRDMTLRVFDPTTISNFIPDALFEINVYNPPTHLDYNYFVAEVRDADGNVTEVRENENTNLLVLGTELAVIRHLMRTYVEQPLPTGGQITYEDRRDYLQRWGTIYQIEYQRYDGLLKLWKRQFLNMNQGKLLVSSKAGRLLPAPLRTRNIGRGYY